MQLAVHAESTLLRLPGDSSRGRIALWPCCLVDCSHSCRYSTNLGRVYRTKLCGYVLNSALRSWWDL